MAGLTVAIVALPLAMALAIASGTTPDKGLVTAVVAGFLISLLGGSRFQIGGPTGAFIPVVFGVIAEARLRRPGAGTLMAGADADRAGLLRLGTLMKYMPQPVVVGFTAGIAVIIFSSQIKDLLGLRMAKVPAEFLRKLAGLRRAPRQHRPGHAACSPPPAGADHRPAALRAALARLPDRVALGALAVCAFGLPVETIGSRFGGIPSSLPAFGDPADPVRAHLRAAARVSPSPSWPASSPCCRRWSPTA
jgi:SulP family sulfate permease